jgi:hypothetical protein
LIDLDGRVAACKALFYLHHSGIEWRRDRASASATSAQKRSSTCTRQTLYCFAVGNKATKVSGRQPSFRHARRCFGTLAQMGSGQRLQWMLFLYCTIGELVRPRSVLCRTHFGIFLTGKNV